MILLEERRPTQLKIEHYISRPMLDTHTSTLYTFLWFFGILCLLLVCILSKGCIQNIWKSKYCTRENSGLDRLTSRLTWLILPTFVLTARLVEIDEWSTTFVYSEKSISPKYTNQPCSLDVKIEFNSQARRGCGSLPLTECYSAFFSIICDDKLILSKETHSCAWSGPDSPFSNRRFDVLK